MKVLQCIELNKLTLGGVARLAEFNVSSQLSLKGEYSSTSQVWEGRMFILGKNSEQRAKKEGQDRELPVILARMLHKRNVAKWTWKGETTRLFLIFNIKTMKDFCHGSINKEIIIWKKDSNNTCIDIMKWLDNSWRISSEAVRGSSFQRLNLWGFEKGKFLFPMDNFIKIFDSLLLGRKGNLVLWLWESSIVFVFFSPKS